MKAGEKIRMTMKRRLPALMTAAIAAAVIIYSGKDLSAQTAVCYSFGDCLNKGIKTDLRRERIQYYTKALGYWSRSDSYRYKAAVYVNRGSAYYDLNQFDKAIADYDKAIGLDPGGTAAYNDRGIAYAEIKQYDKALADYAKAISLDPKDGTEYNNRGVVYLWLDKCEKTRADLEKAIQLDPREPVYYESFGVYWWRCKHDKKGALTLMEKSFMMGFDRWEELELDTSDGYLLKGLRETPEFTVLVNKYRKNLPPAMEFKIKKPK